MNDGLGYKGNRDAFHNRVFCELCSPYLVCGHHVNSDEAILSQVINSVLKASPRRPGKPSSPWVTMPPCCLGVA